MKKFFRGLWQGWKKIALKIARFQTALFLAIFYFLILAPLGGLFRLFGWDPLDTGRKKRKAPTNWKQLDQTDPDMEALRRQS